MERRGRIPIATYRTPEGKTRSRSRVRDPNYNKSDPDTDLFMLLEDNITLREENESLTAKISASVQEKNQLEKENQQFKKQITELTQEQKSLKSQIIELNQSLHKITDEKLSLNNKQQESSNIVKKLAVQLEELKVAHKDYIQMIEANKNVKEQINKILPEVIANDYESLLDIEKDPAGLIAIESIEKLLNEFKQMKKSLNNAELQLYEANEKISELLENQNHFEEEIENLRLENTNLTRVAELMTTNVKESVTTSKKMEEALIEMKRRNDELSRRNLDSLDSPTISQNSTTNEDIIRLQDEIKKRDLAHGERIVEMKALMDNTIENTSNEEIKLLNIKLEMLETQLKDAIQRAEVAENELNHIKKTTINNISNIIECKSPPPPPPMPNKLLIKPHILSKSKNLTDSINSCNLKSGLRTDTSNKDLLNSNNDDNDDDNNNSGSSSNLLRKQQVEATGLDALVKEFKDGNVTLRRARRKTRTNDALQEMFEVLELSRKQNRNSKIFIKNHITTLNLPESNY